VRPERRQALAIRWLIESSRKRGEHTMEERLSSELMDAANNRGTAVKKRRILSQHHTPRQHVSLSAVGESPRTSYIFSFLSDQQSSYTKAFSLSFEHISIFAVKSDRIVVMLPFYMSPQQVVTKTSGKQTSFIRRKNCLCQSCGLGFRAFFCLISLWLVDECWLNQRFAGIFTAYSVGPCLLFCMR